MTRMGEAGCHGWCSEWIYGGWMKKFIGWKRVWLVAWMVVGAGTEPEIVRGQAAVAGGGRALAFEVASVRENKSDEPEYTNFPLSPGPQFGAVGGHLVGRNVLLLQYIVFAVKPRSEQIQQLRQGLPDWTRNARYDIDARAEGNPTKDEMRAMVMTLLSDRFKMRVHRESREAPVFALMVVKPGRLGPKLKPHPADDPGCTKVPLAEPYGNAYPAVCGGSTMIAPSTPGLTAIGGQNVTIANIAIGLSNAQNNVERRVVDETGLSGGFDFSLEWMPEETGASAAETPADAVGATFFEALKDQLGLKLVPQKGMVDVLVVDGIERPSAN